MTNKEKDIYRIKFDEHFKSNDILYRNTLYIATANEKTCHMIGNFIGEDLFYFMSGREVQFNINGNVFYEDRNFPYVYMSKRGKPVMLLLDNNLNDGEIFTPIKLIST